VSLRQRLRSWISSIEVWRLTGAETKLTRRPDLDKRGPPSLGVVVGLGSSIQILYLEN